MDPAKAEGKAKSTKRGDTAGSRKRAHSITVVSSQSPSDIPTPDVTKRTRFAESDSSVEISEITPAPAVKLSQRKSKSATGKASTTTVAEKKPTKAKRTAKVKTKYTSKEFVMSDEEGEEEERNKEEVGTAPQSTCTHSISIDILLTCILMLQRALSPSESFAPKPPLRQQVCILYLSFNTSILMMFYRISLVAAHSLSPVISRAVQSPPYDSIIGYFTALFTF